MNILAPILTVKMSDRERVDDVSGQAVDVYVNLSWVRAWAVKWSYAALFAKCVRCCLSTEPIGR
jgi:hypothetical protein